MKAVFYLIVLAALAYGGKYYYDTYLAESVNNTISRTADFVRRKTMDITEKLQKEMDKIKEEHKQIMADHKELMKEHKQIMKDHQRYDKEFKSCNCPM